MGTIKDRIDSEHRKHKDLDWSRIAESKILSEFRELINYIFKTYSGKSKDEIEAELIERTYKINEDSQLV